jgi:tight adherence protein C
VSVTAGAGLGLLAGLGLTAVVVNVPAVRNRHPLELRLAPYVHDAPRPSRLLDESSLTKPFLRDLVRRFDRWVGGSRSARRRLDRSGGYLSVEDFRAEQVVWGAAGGLAGLVLGILLGARAGPAAAGAALLLTVAGALAGVLARDQRLSAAVTERERRIAAEFPIVAEMLALAVTAGEGPVGALERITRTTSGELSRELQRALADTRAGASLTSALDGVATRTAVPALSRFVDGLVIAVERGTPLGDVLRAQAVDAREAGKRALLEAGGRKEIQMMLPVVFLILPITVLFALFPGYYGLTLTT